MNRKDVLRIVGYVVGIGGLLTEHTLALLLQPWGIPDPAIGKIAGEVGSVVLGATLVYSVAARPSPPPGYSAVIAPDPTTTVDNPAATAVSPQFLTTASALKKGP